jgi:hypothetical protein
MLKEMHGFQGITRPGPGGRDQGSDAVLFGINDGLMAAFFFTRKSIRASAR